MTSMPVLPVAQWESLRRDLIWIRMGGVDEAHRELTYHPKGMIAAWRMIRGTGRFELAGRIYPIKAGQWLFPGPSRGKRWFSPQAEIISIRFRVQWPDGESLFDHRTPLVSKGVNPRLDQAGFALARFVQGELSPNGVLLPRADADLSRYLQLRRLFERWFEAYMRFLAASDDRSMLARPVDERILEIVRNFEKQIRSGEKPTEEKLARESGLSLSHFKRLFVRDLRQTPKEWADGKRLEIVCERLRETRDPIKRVAYEMGFRSPNHFSSWFRKVEGKTPSRFRWQSQRKNS